MSGAGVPGVRLAGIPVVRLASVPVLRLAGVPIVRLSRRWKLAASHRLHAEGFDAERNQAVYGKCNNPHGHGHNYVIEVTVSGPVDRETGMVTNLSELDRFAAERLLARYDYANLNTLEEFQELVPTTENFALAVERIFREYPHARLEHVHVEETPNNSFDTIRGAGQWRR